MGYFVNRKEFINHFKNIYLFMRYLFILLSCGILVSCSAQQKLLSKENGTLSINHETLLP